MSLAFTIPIKTVSEANSHTHWRVRQRRAKAQRAAARLLAATNLRAFLGVMPLMVTIVRVSPRELDDDNLAGSQKHVRDGIADALGIDDRSPLVSWRYGQRRGTKGQYAVDVRIASVGAST